LLASCIPVRRHLLRGAFLEIDCEVRNHSSSWACYPVFKDRRPTAPLPAVPLARGRGFYRDLGNPVKRPHSFFVPAAWLPAPVGVHRRGGERRGGVIYVGLARPVNTLDDLFLHMPPNNAQAPEIKGPSGFQSLRCGA